MRNYDHIVQREGEAYEDFRMRQLVETGSHCAYCGCCVERGGMFVVEHVVPKSRGGTDGPDNLVVACQSCNISKGARTADEWRDVIAERAGVDSSQVVFALEEKQGHRIIGERGRYFYYLHDLNENPFLNKVTSKLGL